MSTFDGQFESLIQGVSQQVPNARLSGQVSEQINMISDPVTGVRRRAGSTIEYNVPFDPPACPKVDMPNHILAWRADIAGVVCECVLNTNTGQLVLREENGILHHFQNDYFKTDTLTKIQHTTVGESMFLLNMGNTPSIRPLSARNFKANGFFTIKGAAINRTYTVRVTVSGTTVTGSYTTPDGTKPEHAEQASAEAIARGITAGLSHANLAVVNTGISTMIQSHDGTPITVMSDNSVVYMEVTNSGFIESVGYLPQRIVPSYDFCLAVGKIGDSPSYYRFIKEDTRWEETSNPSQRGELINMPLEIYWDSDNSKYVVDDKPFLGRLSGDEESNPDPDFVSWGITGMGSYQGRLVLLSGSYVWLSAVHTPRQFYRLTVNDLLDSDPIGLGSSNAASASFRYCVPFNKDLILFSDSHQAILQGTASGLSPKNAHIVVTSSYTVDISTPPVATGRSVLFSIPRGGNHFGIMEMIPSPYTDSQYISVDITEHIPTYLEGRCRFMVASSVSGVVLFGSTTTLEDIYVHEYIWGDDGKILKAWHKWHFEYPVADSFFDSNHIKLATWLKFEGQEKSSVLVSSINPRGNINTHGGIESMLLDYKYVVEPENHFITLPTEFDNLASVLGISKDVKVAYIEGGLKNTKIGSEKIDNVIEINKSCTATEVVAGVEYSSSIVPSPPTIKDWQGNVIDVGKTSLIKLYVSTNNTGLFKVSVDNIKSTAGALEFEVDPIVWYSTALSLGKTPVGGQVSSVVPVRSDSKTTRITFESDGIAEFNIVSMEYTVMYNRRRNRG